MKLLISLLCALFLSSCTFSISAEELLSPPKMSHQQESIYRALEDAVGSSSFKFKYPRRGENLSAVILKDIDFDGVEEGFAFYELQTGSSVSTWISFLRQKDGVWQSVREIPAASSDIDMVSFAKITDSNRENIVVGWAIPGEEYSSCCIYSFDGNDAKKDHDVEFIYTDMLLENVDENELNEIILATKTKTRSSLRLVKFRAGKIVTSGLLSMPENIKEYKQLKFGKLTDNLNCIFADVLLTSGNTETKLVAVENSTILEVDSEEVGIYESFVRQKSPFVVSDVNSDGILDIPVTSLLPGYEDSKENDRLYITSFVTLKNGETEYIKRVIYNEEDNYYLEIPKSWGNSVTVKKQSDTGEWRFYIYNGSENVAEILRINAVDDNEYQDKLQIHDYKLLSEVGSKRYVCYIPTEIYPGYTMSFEELSQAFHVGSDINR